MGTGSSRESGPTSQGSPRKKGKPFSDQTVELLIREQKLAPRGVVEEADAVLQGVVVEEAQIADDKECPICFLNYQALNSVVCCKQSICTNCYVELRNTQPVAKNCHCPFCHQLGFVTTYSATPKFDYSNDRQFEGSAKKEAAAPTSSQRRGSGGGFPHPSAIAEKAAEKLTSAFESMRASVNGGSGSSKASSSQTLGAHHFLQQDSWDSPMRNLHADHSSQNEGTNPRTPTATATATAATATASASGASGEGSKVNRRASDPNTPSRSTPTSVPLASKADRASLEAQIRSQHADFDAEREYRRQSSSGGRQRAESEQLASHQRARSIGGGSPRTRTGSPRSPRSEIEGLGRLLAGLGARSPSGQPVMASYEDIARMEELMLQAALRESAQMAEAAPAPSSGDSESGSSANSTTGSGAAVTDAADVPPPVPPSSTSSTSAGTGSGAAFSAAAAAASEGRASNIAQRTATEVAVEMAVERENGGGRTESQASEDAELELALALSLEESHATVDSSHDSES